MPIITSQFNDLVKNALVSWREGYDGVEERARQMYDIIGNENLNTEYSGIDRPGFAKRKTEGGAYAVGSPVQGYSLLLQKSRIGLADGVSWEMRKYDKYRQIEQKMKGLGGSTAARIELDLTHLFTFGLQGTAYTNMDGDSVATTTGDGLQIFSASHTITGGSTTNSNYIGTTAFSQTGLEAAERLFANMVNNNTVKVPIKATHIITGDEPAVINAVRQFLNSTMVPDSADGAVNVYKGKYEHLILPNLATSNLGAPSATGRYYWMLADLANKDAILEFSEMPTFKMAKPDSNGDNFNTDEWNAKSSASYAYGVLDYKWICGSAATTV